jgi:PAS domain S-box-containing protein
MPTDVTHTYRWLYTVAHTLHEQLHSPHGILKTTLSLSQRALGAEGGCILTFDANGALHDAYLPERDVDGNDNALWQQLSNLTRSGNRSVTVGDLSVDRPWPRTDHSASSTMTGSAVSVPLLRDARLMGVLMLRHSTPLYFDDTSLRLLEKIAETAAVALENAERFEMLADSQALYRRLYKDASFPIIITDLRGEIVDANPKAYTLLGFDRQALMGLPLAAVLRVGSEPLSKVNLDSAAAVEELVLTATARTSSAVMLSVRLLARRVRLDTADYLVWVLQDMSEQVAQDEHRRDLSAMIYHDLRGPLHNINLGLTRVDKLMSDAPPAVADLLHLALGSTHQLTRMVNSLLDVEQLEAGQAQLDLKPIAVSELVRQSVDAVSMLSAEAGHRFEQQISPSLPLLNVDVDMMIRVIVNLLENAIKYTPPDEPVIVQADRVNGHVRVVVSDRGPGIPEDMRELIFDKYVRVRNNRVQRGVGLGLAFCRLAVQAHGGQIWVEDHPPQGSNFIIALPL